MSPIEERWDADRRFYNNDAPTAMEQPDFASPPFPAARRAGHDRVIKCISARQADAAAASAIFAATVQTTEMLIYAPRPIAKS